MTDFPLPGGERLELDVAAFDLTGPATRFFVGDKGEPIETTGPAVRYFRGTVVGDPESLVSLNLFGGRFAGFLRTGGKEYTFAPRAFAPEDPAALMIEIRSDAEETGPTGSCDGDEKLTFGAGDAIDSLARPVAPAAIGPTTLLRAKVAIEGTIEWVARHGGITGAQLYTLNLLSQVSAVYEAEVGVQIQVPYVLMNSAEPDGYTGESNSTGTMLTEMRTRWNGSATLRGVFRSATHLFSTYPSGGSGRAYVNVLCGNVPENPASNDYGVSLLYGGGGSWERRLVAHELGHNFSSPHSHCFTPELDQCNNTQSGCYAGTVVQTVGSMMSYCNSVMTSFHQREVSEKIRPAAEAAFPECVEVVGDPGSVAQLTVVEPPSCAPASLQNDDGATNGVYGYSGATRAAWVKRLRPTCYPFRLGSIDVKFGNASVAPGRAIRLLVYTDPSGSGSVVNSTLVYSADTTIQMVNSSQWNHYPLASPVILASGDYYIGFLDLVADSTSSYLMDYDTRTASDSWMQGDSTDPFTFNPFPGGSGSWMIRGSGGPLAPGSVQLAWDPPCNDASVPGQDFAIYQGTVGDWSGYTSLTCTTGHQRVWFVESPPSGAYWLAVPQSSLSEGSYGQSTSGERPQAAAACRPQVVGTCQ